MSDPNYKVISEDIFRECNTVGIQINLAKPDSVDLLQLIKEREELKKKLESKEKEINTLLAKQYDLTTKIEKLQKNISIINYHCIDIKIQRHRKH